MPALLRLHDESFEATVDRDGHRAVIQLAYRDLSITVGMTRLEAIRLAKQILEECRFPDEPEL